MFHFQIDYERKSVRTEKIVEEGKICCHLTNTEKEINNVSLQHFKNHKLFHFNRSQPGKNI